MEVMIAVSIFAVISGGLYSILRHANRQGSKAFTRQDLVTQANSILKQLQDDFRCAASASVKVSNDGGQIQLNLHIENKLATVTYRWEKPKFIRKVEYDNKTTIHVFSNNFEKFEMEKKPRPTGENETCSPDTPEQVLLRVTLSGWVPGDPKPLVHEQHCMATMREISSLKYDPHWKDVGNLQGAFHTYGDLMGSLAEDAKAMVEDFSKGIEDTIKDAENAVKNASQNPAEARNQLNNALNEIKKGKQDLKEKLNDLEERVENLPEKIFETKWYNWNTWTDGQKKDALKRVSNEFNKMKTKEDMDYNKLKKAAGSFDLNDAFKEFFNAKKDAFETREKMNENENKVNQMLSNLDKGMGTNE